MYIISDLCDKRPIYGRERRDWEEDGYPWGVDIGRVLLLIRSQMLCPLSYGGNMSDKTLIIARDPHLWGSFCLDSQMLTS